MTKNFPLHIAIIPDGNRRWAKKGGLFAWDGHKKGEEKFRQITQAAFETGIPYVTLWAASEDNLQKRSAEEVKFLVKIYSEGLERELASRRLMKDRVRFRVIGRWKEALQGRGFPRDPELERRVEALEKGTEEFTERHLTFLFGYDGRREMLDAISKISRMAPVDGDALRSALSTGFLPDVDLVIRTGEEREEWFHNSAGFLMWLCANAEYYHTKTFWPEFSEEEFSAVIRKFGECRRKLGS